MKTNEIVNKAISYIMQHINEEIKIEDVSKYCHFSKYYFSRIFKMETGESIYAFIKRMKLEQSAFRLKVERGRTVTDIGFDYGYLPSNYSQAFRKYYEKSPVEFRSEIKEISKSHPFFSGIEVELESFEECSKKVEINTIEDFEVLYERRIGNYRDLGREWDAFFEKYHAYINDDTKYVERTFDDPSITNADNCIYDLCMTIPKGLKADNIYTISGGKYVIYHYKGYIEKIYCAYQNMFQVWFPKTNRKIDNRYGFEVYHSMDCDNYYTEMDIYFPII